MVPLYDLNRIHFVSEACVFCLLEFQDGEDDLLVWVTYSGDGRTLGGGKEMVRADDRRGTSVA